MWYSHNENQRETCRWYKPVPVTRHSIRAISGKTSWWSYVLTLWPYFHLCQLTVVKIFLSGYGQAKFCYVYLDIPVGHWLIELYGIARADCVGTVSYPLCRPFIRTHKRSLEAGCSQRRLLTILAIHSDTPLILSAWFQWSPIICYWTLLCRLHLARRPYRVAIYVLQIQFVGSFHKSSFITYSLQTEHRAQSMPMEVERLHIFIFVTSTFAWT